MQRHEQSEDEQQHQQAAAAEAQLAEGEGCEAGEEQNARNRDRGDNYTVAGVGAHIADRPGFGPVLQINLFRQRERRGEDLPVLPEGRENKPEDRVGIEAGNDDHEQIIQDMRERSAAGGFPAVIGVFLDIQGRGRQGIHLTFS